MNKEIICICCPTTVAWMMKAMKTEMCIRVCRAVYGSVNLKIRQNCEICHPDYK